MRRIQSPRIKRVTNALCLVFVASDVPLREIRTDDDDDEDDDDVFTSHYYRGD